jgi:predicted nucleic acid-binding protein
MSGEFLDTNVFVYLIDPDVVKQARAKEIVSRALKSGGVISFQVVQETLNVMIGKAASPVSSRDAMSIFDEVLSPLWGVMPSVGLYRRAVGIADRYRYAFYDSLIIAAALEAGCDRLLTEDMQDGQRIDGLTIVNPFS